MGKRTWAASTVGYLAGLEHSLHRMSICGESSISFATRILFILGMLACVDSMRENDLLGARAERCLAPCPSSPSPQSISMISPRAVVSITVIVTVFTSILAAITILTTILVTILIPTLVNIIINNVTFFFIVVVNILPLIVLTQAAAHSSHPSNARATPRCS